MIRILATSSFEFSLHSPESQDAFDITGRKSVIVEGKEET